MACYLIAVYNPYLTIEKKGSIQRAISWNGTRAWRAFLRGYGMKLLVQYKTLTSPFQLSFPRSEWRLAPGFVCWLAFHFDFHRTKREIAQWRRSRIPRLSCSKPFQSKPLWSRLDLLLSLVLTLLCLPSLMNKEGFLPESRFEVCVLKTGEIESKGSVLFTPFHYMSVVFNSFSGSGYLLWYPRIPHLRSR